MKKPRQPLADKVLKRIQKEVNKEVVDLSAVRTGRKHAQDLQKEIDISPELAEMHPSFAAYAWVQHQISIMGEQLLGLKSLNRFHEVIDQSEMLYTPEGPPESPLTPSYYNGWLLFDLGVGIARETLGTIAIAVHRKYGAHENFLILAKQMVESCNGVYQITGVNDSGLISMKEIWTGDEFTARNASGYDGKVEEIWITRILPPNDMEPGVHVVFSTPYVMYQTSVDGWIKYFNRVLVPSVERKRPQDFYQHMKFGEENFYWPEYIFNSYVNHTENYIMAKGLPDIDKSLPHKDEYEISLTW